MIYTLLVLAVSDRLGINTFPVLPALIPLELADYVDCLSNLS